ncbi:hypothetical protein [Cupriavidus pauculus]|jgi:hypothetical protein|uniref:hypothetical protein n=1 Tax=Cupriavidus pauculus TaxID=82633 RepID=UPI00147865C9|nr:hypothetical protein [Cupriavidus pauculus]UAK99557.1 hypothetical protein K8O84_16540 [Cupriavidus pauculus]
MAETCCTAEQLALIGINAQDIAYAYAWGFGAVLTAWFFGFCVGVAVDVIRKA